MNVVAQFGDRLLTAFVVIEPGQARLSKKETSFFGVASIANGIAPRIMALPSERRVIPTVFSRASAAIRIHFINQWILHDPSLNAPADGMPEGDSVVVDLEVVSDLIAH